MTLSKLIETEGNLFEDKLAIYELLKGKDIRKRGRKLLKSYFLSAIKEAAKEMAKEVRLKLRETFMDFLADKHAKNYQGLDDDMPDAFDNWLIDLEIDDAIRYTNEYINQVKADLDKKIDLFTK